MADCSLMARYGTTAPRGQWTMQRLLGGEGRLNGSSTATSMDGATAPQRRGTARQLLDGEGRRERGGDGPRA